VCVSATNDKIKAQTGAVWIVVCHTRVLVEVLGFLVPTTWTISVKNFVIGTTKNAENMNV